MLNTQPFCCFLGVLQCLLTWLLGSYSFFLPKVMPQGIEENSTPGLPSLPRVLPAAEADKYTEKLSGEQTRGLIKQFR